MASQDVEAGRAYVTLYLRRVGFDQQVEQALNDTSRMESQASGSPQQPYTEAGISIPSELAEAAAKGAAMRAGGALLARYIPLFREMGTAATGAATATAATATAATAAAPAVAATGAAATGAATGLAAMATALLPIIVPLAAIAAAAGLVYVALVKWKDLSAPVKLLLAALFPIVAVVRLLVFAFQALKLALLPLVVAFRAVGAGVSLLTAPFRLAAATIGLFVSAIKAIPAAIAAIPGLMVKAGAAAWDMAKRIGKATADMTSAVGRATAATAAALAMLPGQIAGYASSAASSVASTVQSLGMSIAKAAAIAAGITAAIVGPLTLAAKAYGEYGEKIRGIQNEYQRFALTAEEASIIARVSEQTGESVQKLAEQMRDGTRDFSRWRAEVRASGMEMSSTGLGAALALSRAYYALRESLAGLRMTLGAAVAPAITESTQVITGAIRAVTAWAAENKPLIAQIFKIASTVGLAAGAVVTLGGAIAGAGTVLSPFTAALAAIAGGMALVEWRTGAGRSLWASYGDAVRQVYATVTTYLGQMAAFTGRVLGGIKDALIAGDLAAAVNVAWAGAKVAWITALTEIDSLTRGAFGGILQSLAAGDWASAGQAVMGQLQIAWQTGIVAIAGLWGQIVDAADTAWMGLQQGFDGMLGTLKNGIQGLFEDMKQWGVDFLRWMKTSVLGPLGSAMGLAGGPATAAALKLSNLANDLAGTIKTPEQLAADQEAADNAAADRQADRESNLLDRQADRAGAMHAQRLAAEKEVERLRRQQADLAAKGAMASGQDRSKARSDLEAALAAAKAAREAADAARPKADDFAVSTATESITRFSGEALAMSVGRATEEPQKRIAKLSEQQLAEVKVLVTNSKETLTALKDWASGFGFA